MILVVITCNNPAEQIPYNPMIYYSPVDSAWKAIINLEWSYNVFNLIEYINCFRSDYSFCFEAAGDTISWGFDTEQDIHQSMFIQASQICLVWLGGSEQYPWSGDTTGATLVLARDYSLRVWMSPEDTILTTAYGTANFICRQDSMEEWYIWQWWDYPDPGEDGWSDIKLLFCK